VLTIQIILSIIIAAALLVPLSRIIGRMRRDEADAQDKTVFIVLIMSLCFFVAFLRWWFVPWLNNLL
jgi:O-antigen ligase